MGADIRLQITCYSPNNARKASCGVIHESIADAVACRIVDGKDRQLVARDPVSVVALRGAGWTGSCVVATHGG